MTWTDQGYIHLGRLLGATEIAHLQEALDRTRDQFVQGPYGILHHNLAHELDCFAELLPLRIAPRVLEALGTPELRLFQDHLIWKPSGTEAALAWHQDYSYWPLAKPSGVTVWLALDDIDSENGGLRYVPGSHLWGERRAAEFVAGARQFQDPELPPIEFSSDLQTYDVRLRAGEAIVHHPLLWHMSPGNPTSRERRAWSLTFLFPGTRWDSDHAPHPYSHEVAPVKGTRVEESAFPVFRRQ